MAHVADHANNAPPVILVPDLPDGILAGPGARARVSLTRMTGSPEGVSRSVKSRPRATRCPWRSDSRRSRRGNGFPATAPRLYTCPLPLTPNWVAAERQYVGQTRGLYARDGVHAAEHFSEVTLRFAWVE